MNMDKKLRVLAAGAHPDDIEICCAGTLARYAKEGHKVFISVTCKGNAGTLEKSGDEMVAIRKKEAEKAAEIIGGELIMLGFGDGELVHDKNSLAAFIDLVRRTSPDIILTHPEEEEDWHNDHMLTRRLIIDASIWATHHNLWVESKYPPTTVTPALFFFDMYVNGFKDRPAHYVDITDTYATKVEAMKQHKSQLGFLSDLFKQNYLDVIEIQGRMRGIQCGVKYAEAFKELAVYPRVRPYRLLP
jgi:N-acetylglucosamine malate deacetylase 1